MQDVLGENQVHRIQGTWMSHQSDNVGKGHNSIHIRKREDIFDCIHSSFILLVRGSMQRLAGKRRDLYRRSGFNPSLVCLPK